MISSVKCTIRFMVWVAAPSLCACGATLHTDDFQSGQAGWTSGGAIVSLINTGGPAGDGDSFIRVVPGLANLATHNSTTEWTGDFSAVGAALISADLMAAAGASPLSIRAVLFGPGANPPNALTPQWTSTAAVDVPADGTWRSYAFSLAETDLTQVRGQTVYEDLMTGVLRVMLRHDPGSPSSGGSAVAGDLGVDNITLSATASVAGDYDHDGDADGLDLLLWQRGESPNPLSAADLAAWQTSFGSPPPGTNLTMVAEPGAGAIYLVLPWFWQRRRRRRAGADEAGAAATG